jgi:hypothetical protein
MAAHVKTALEQIITDKYPSGHIRAALNFSCWVEDLSLADYVKFDDVCNHFVMTDREKDMYCKELAKQLLPYYTILWESLGKPDNREAWHKAVYG